MSSCQIAASYTRSVMRKIPARSARDSSRQSSFREPGKITGTTTAIRPLPIGLFSQIGENRTIIRTGSQKIQKGLGGQCLAVFKSQHFAVFFLAVKHCGQTNKNRRCARRALL